ncbi:TRAP transporter small permease [Sulfitobacter sabulilitoris]|uniref:TRAP transporter small permease protein n=1 Tax=Sulfitobacter sabulilitoris TaxID=2562655 RepID=A0A5S3Q4Z3_9RHOB|nr:TRAP transporter small permease [Sulfitobacter sabulilitoris]TMM51742.1 TRAP transporter small permease [Sulfitobacter sabulilitoris]
MIVRLFSLIAGSLAALALLGMALLTLFDVVGRNLLRQPVPGATELTEIGLVAVTFLLYPLIAYRQSHISVDLFDDFMSPAVRRILGVIGNLLGGAVFAVFAWQLWKQADRLMGYGDVTSYLRLPLGPFVYFMAIASGATVIGFAVAAIATALGRDTTDDTGQIKSPGYE